MAGPATTALLAGLVALAAAGWALRPVAPDSAIHHGAAPIAATPDFTQAPVVLELFTSQGCSSCPPADALVEQLARTRGDMLVISRPVTYWDRLGWRDTLAKPENTDLQRAYAARGLAGYNGVYTPQAVIDGRSGTVGSNAQDIAALFRQAMPDKRHAPQIALAAAHKVTVVGAANLEAQLSLVALDSRETVSIALGENRDRTITYTNLLVGEAPLGTWRGGAATFDLPRDYRATAGADSFALILRQGQAGPILAARRL